MGLTKCEEEAIEHTEDPGVPAPVLLVEERIHGVASQQGEQQP